MIDRKRVILYIMSCVQQEHKTIRNARVAQLVERDLAKVEAAGSSPVSRSFHAKGYPIGYPFLHEMSPDGLRTGFTESCSEVSEDIKSSSVGANHWSPRPIAPSRAPAQRNVVQNVIDQSFGEM